MLVNLYTFVCVTNFSVVCEWSNHCTLVYIHLNNASLISGLFSFFHLLVQYFCHICVILYDFSKLIVLQYPFWPWCSMISFVIWTEMYTCVNSDTCDILVDVRPRNSYFLYCHIRTAGNFHCFHFQICSLFFKRIKFRES